MSWRTAFATRPEHLYTGPRRCGKSSIVDELRANGYWAHEHTTESGDEIARIYSAQRKLYEADPSAQKQPRMFFTDRAWWLYSARFHYVNPYLKAEISFPERELELLLPDRSTDWLYRHGADARERLIPELAVAINEMGPGPGSAFFLEKVYPELVPVLTYCIPQFKRLPPNLLIRMPRKEFESGVHSYRLRHPLPDGLTSKNIVEYLIATGLCEYAHTYYLRIARAYAGGLIYLKNSLTHDAISARVGMKG